MIQQVHNATDYRARRKQLMSMISPDAIAVISAGALSDHAQSARYPTHQESNFLYLTGLDELDLVLVLYVDAKGEGKSALFHPPQDPVKAVWDGPRLSDKELLERHQFDAVYDTDTLATHLEKWMNHKQTVYYDFNHERTYSILAQSLQSLSSAARAGSQSPSILSDIRPMVETMRSIKTDSELLYLQRAIDVTCQGHRAVMQRVKPGLYEYQLEATLLYEFMDNGCQGVGYRSIVGSGDNACILHYVNNNQQIQDGDVVLVDAGAQYEGYTADITRTFPANGRFGAAGQAVYESVLAAQKAVIDQVKPGQNWQALQKIAVQVLLQGLCDMGILSGSQEGLLESQAYKPYFMHSIGHWLGLEVHDVASCYGPQGSVFKPGMVLTVEPGLYFASTIPGLDKKWQGIGVRIEDNVLVTETGCKVLSQALPKEVADIYTEMA